MDSYYSNEDEEVDDYMDDYYGTTRGSYMEDDYGYNDNVVDNYNYGSSVSDSLRSTNLMDDVTVTISNLVELNKNLQAMVDENERRLAKCNASRRKLVELSKSQAREISNLNARLVRLESEKQVLEAKVSALTPSSNGELVRAMADAQNILGQTKNRLRRNSKEY